MCQFLAEICPAIGPWQSCPHESVSNPDPTCAKRDAMMLVTAVSDALDQQAVNAPCAADPAVELATAHNTRRSRQSPGW